MNPTLRDRPWLTEPDYEAFTAHDLLCVMQRHSGLKHWCGYVGVPPTHLLYGVDKGALIAYPEGWRDEALFVDEVGAVNLLHHALTCDEIPAGQAPIKLVMTVHGGLSYADHLADRPDLWFFGFDCGHAGDYSPGMFDYLDGFHIDSLRDAIAADSIYRTIGYVKSECVHLAEQLAGYPALLRPDAAR